MRFGFRAKFRKIILITLISIGSLVVILGVSAYFILHGYINKMNLVTSEDDSEGQNGISTVSPAPDLSSSEAFAEAAGEAVTDGYPQGSEDSDVPDNSEVSAAGNTEETGPDTVPEKVLTFEDKLHQNAQNQVPFPKNENDVLNILLIGSDTRSENERGRSDTMMLISINKSAKLITATSFLRDIYVVIPGYKDNRLNAAYQFGGARLLIDTIEKNFKIKIDHYVSVNFFTFMDIVDAVGGVSLEVTEKERPAVNNYINEINLILGKAGNSDFLTKPGEQLLNGKQALGYARVRSVGNNDFARTQRQRTIMQQLYNKLKKLNILEWNDLLNTILPQITTDFTEDEILSNLLSLPSYLNYDTQQWSIPLSGSYTDLLIRKMEVLGIDFEETRSELLRRIYLTE